MAHLYPFQGLLLNLQEKIAKHSRAYLPKEEAYKLLKKWTNQDFGYDVDNWKEYIKTNRRTLSR
jgi:hypothetical protein